MIKLFTKEFAVPFVKNYVPYHNALKNKITGMWFVYFDDFNLRVDIRGKVFLKIILIYLPSCNQVSIRFSTA